MTVTYFEEGTRDDWGQTALTGALSVPARGVRRAFDSRGVLHHLDLDMAQGEFVALVGRSGTGKSTFLRILAGLDQQYRGDVLVARRRSVVFPGTASHALATSFAQRRVGAPDPRPGWSRPRGKRPGYIGRSRLGR